MSSRTEQHMRNMIAGIDNSTSKTLPSATFAPILPIDREQQIFYYDLLEGEWRDTISGLAIYDANTATTLPETLEDLPRLSLAESETPHKLLRGIALGIDIFTIPFIGAATDAGVALSFRFGSNTPPPPPQNEQKQKHPLGLPLSSPSHASSLSPLVPDCTCFACTAHHLAYLHHLLSAKEMLAWVLLQIHNLAIIDAFFIDVRRSIAAGTFEADVRTFAGMYEAEMPVGTGVGPRCVILSHPFSLSLFLPFSFLSFSLSPFLPFYTHLTPHHTTPKSTTPTSISNFTRTPLEDTANTTHRVRGYQYRSEGPGEAKRNPSAFSRVLQGRADQNADAPLPDADAGAAELAGRGVADLDPAGGSGRER